MNIKVALLAEEELNDAYVWYESQLPKLGLRFLDEFDRTIRRIRAFPSSGIEIESGLRRVLISRFPYGIIYHRENDTIIIIAVAHLHCLPRYWVDRIEDNNDPI